MGKILSLKHFSKYVAKSSMSRFAFYFWLVTKKPGR